MLVGEKVLKELTVFDTALNHQNTLVELVSKVPRELWICIDLRSVSLTHYEYKETTCVQYVVEPHLLKELELILPAQQNLRYLDILITNFSGIYLSLALVTEHPAL